MCGLVFEWIKEQGGLPEMEDISDLKANAIYDVIDNSNGFFQ